MADIKQAAKWMQEGKRVRRPAWDQGWHFVQYGEPFENVLISMERVFMKNNRAAIPAQLNTVDLLADDWEIAP